MQLLQTWEFRKIRLYPYLSNRQLIKIFICSLNHTHPRKEDCPWHLSWRLVKCKSRTDYIIYSTSLLPQSERWYFRRGNNSVTFQHIWLYKLMRASACNPGQSRLDSCIDTTSTSSPLPTTGATVRFRRQTAVNQLRVSVGRIGRESNA